MLIRSNFIQIKHFTLMLNLLVALFFVTVLVLKKGYSYVPMVLGGISVIYTLVYFFKFNQKWQLAKADEWLIFSFLFYFITFLLSIIINNDSFRESYYLFHCYFYLANSLLKSKRFYIRFQ